jgi:hypothetical protein
MGSFSLFHWLLTIGILYLVYAVLNSIFGTSGKVDPNGAMICPNCGSRGEPKTTTRGNIAIEIVLWLCFIIPGLIYSVWRTTTKYKACPSCGSAGMIGVNTPNGRMLADKLNVNKEGSRCKNCGIEASEGKAVCQGCGAVLIA